MNPVEGIYAAFPALLYLNSTWASSVLLPHLKYHSGSQDGTSYVAPDLGVPYLLMLVSFMWLTLV